MQRWKPDTCDCIILEEHDGNSTYNSHEFICPVHQGMTALELSTIPLDDNRKKNQTHGELLSRLPAQFLTTDADGNTIIKPSLNFSFSFTGTKKNRVLNISLTGLTTPQKSAIQSALDTRFGVGKVIID